MTVSLLPQEGQPRSLARELGRGFAERHHLTPLTLLTEAESGSRERSMLDDINSLI
jgi:hypothetical protein